MDAHGEGPISPAAARDALLRLVLAKGYERREVAFVLSSGGTSRDYVDLRRAVGHGPDLHLAAAAVLGAVSDAGIAFDAIGGLTMGADPVAHAVALLCAKGWFSVRKAEKSHGSGRRIEGVAVGPGVRALVFEDTISTGRSVFEALDVVRATGAEVVAVSALLDRGEATAPRLAELGIAYLALLTYRDLGIEPLDPAPTGAP